MYNRVMNSAIRPFGALGKNSKLWSDPGVAKTGKGGERIVALPGGIERHEYPNGYSDLTGFSIHGAPITHTKSGANEWWIYDLPALAKKLEHDARAAVSDAPRSQTYRFRGGEEIPVTRHMSGYKRAQRFEIRMPGSRASFQIFSDRPLTRKESENAARVIYEAAPVTYSKMKKLYVTGSLGELRKANGLGQRPIKAFTIDSGNIYITYKNLATITKARRVLDHEAGHMVRCADVVPLTGAEENLFGKGKLVRNEGKQSVDLSKSDFVSEYGSRNPSEDFAETHMNALKIRRTYNKRTGGELFSLPPADLRRELKSLRLSAGLRKKITAVIHGYRRAASKTS